MKEKRNATKTTTAFVVVVVSGVAVAVVLAAAVVASIECAPCQRHTNPWVISRHVNAGAKKKRKG